MHRLAVVLFASLLQTWVWAIPKPNARPNVLFLTVDDLRPELRVYLDSGPIHPDIQTPHIDALATHSLLLKNAHVQLALCGPSRTSFLTGRRPESTKVYDNMFYWREVAGNFTTIPQYFRHNDYVSLGIGKIFHPGKASGFDDPPSWSEPFISISAQPLNTTWKAIPMEDVEADPLEDIQIADSAISSLQRFAPGGDLEDQNFFLAVGFHKPHLPFIFPEPYLDLYPENSIQLPLNPYAPYKMPTVAWSTINELRFYEDTANFKMEINETLPDYKTLELRRAYYACVSYVDDQIGRVLDELKRLGFYDNTIVTLLGDHGWKLGDHGAWGKRTNFNLATHAPMMLRVPGVTDQGLVTEAVTEYVDLFPTLVEAAGLPELELCPEDSSAIRVCTEGMSLMPLTELQPPAWKKQGFTYTPSSNTIMGYSMHTSQFRYTEWITFDYDSFVPNWGEVHGVELYDHNEDPMENYNAADDPYYAEVVEELSDMLRKGWREAVPNINNKS